MRARLAERLLAQVMDWDAEQVQDEHEKLVLLSEVKYDKYARFNAGRRFIENLALWLNQFDASDREIAYQFIMKRLIFISDTEMSHLVEMLYRDYVVPEFHAQAAEAEGLDQISIRRLEQTNAYKHRKERALFLGLSDGARTDELRRFNPGEIFQDQVWHAYEIDHEKAKSMRTSLAERVGDTGALFETVWLVDDFSASGKTYIREDRETGGYVGKIPQLLRRLFGEEGVHLANRETCAVYLVLYVATDMAKSHITSCIKTYCEKSGMIEPHVVVIYELSEQVRVTDSREEDLPFLTLVDGPYYDHKAHDSHTAVGGTDDVRRGFAGCALPVVLAHNTPNNSLFLLWGYDDLAVRGLFPRVSRHKEF